MELSTKHGDDGYTEIISGGRIPKSDELIELIGTLDEVSASLGIARLYADNELASDIELLQKDLISAMGELAGGRSAELNIDKIEKLAKKYAASFDGFCIFGKVEVSSYLNLARCVIRRAERICSALVIDKRVRGEYISYLNRMSDLVYAMSMYYEK